MVKPKKVTVGMPCTVSIGSDRYGHKIEKVSPSGRTVWAGGLKFMWKAYKTYDWSGGKTTIAYRWKTAGRNSGYGLYIGKAETYLDPSF